MPINPTTLKALIDTQITNETVDFAITPNEVGSRMKDTIDYTTEQIAGVASTPDATTLVKGKLQLAGDLAGTASLPTVPGLANKQATLVSGTNIQTINGSSILGSGNLVVSGGGVALTTGNVTGVIDNTAILIYGINSVTQTSSDTDKVVLPETDVKIGDEIYVFCEDGIRIRGNVAGEAVISTSLSSNVSVIQAISGDRFRFTKISSLGWTFEKLEGLTGENIINKSTNVTTDGASDTKYPSVKAVKTYVDANAGGTQVIKMEKTIIYSSEILDLHNTKIKIITGEAGKIKYLNSYIIDYEFGSVVYTKTGSGNLALYYGSYGQIGNIQNPFVGATASRKYQFNHFPQLDMQYFSGQENINIGLASGTYNDGDGNITIYAVYTEVTL